MSFGGPRPWPTAARPRPTTTRPSRTCWRLREDYTAALPDLDRTLEINPRHVGALSGRALTLMALGRAEEGQAALRAALAPNPWLAERALLAPAPGHDL